MFSAKDQDDFKKHFDDFKPGLRGEKMATHSLLDFSQFSREFCHFSEILKESFREKTLFKPLPDYLLFRPCEAYYKLLNSGYYGNDMKSLHNSQIVTI